MIRRWLVISTLSALSLVGTLAQTPPELGFPPFGTFQDGGFDAVNLQNLNVHFSIPIMSSPGRGLDLSHAIEYDSAIWKRVGNAWVPAPNLGWQIDNLLGTMTHKVELLPGPIDPENPCTQNRRNYYDYQYTEPDGTVHSFPLYFPKTPIEGCPNWDAPRTGYESGPGRYYIDATVPTAPIVTTPEGNRIASSTATFTDTNGNRISASQVGQVTTWTDTVGRASLIIDKTDSLHVKIKFLDPRTTPPGPNYQTVTLNFATRAVCSEIACAGVANFVDPS